MQAIIRYDTWQEYGFKDEQSFTTEIQIENEEVIVKIQFPEKAKGLSKNSSVTDFGFSFTKDEARKFVAVMSSILDHPNLKGEQVRWENNSKFIPQTNIR